MAEKCISYMSARSTPPHTNPMESGPGNIFSAQNRKKTKRLMTSDTKRGGGIFSTFLTPPPPQKSGLQMGGGVGVVGSGPRTYWGGGRGGSAKGLVHNLLMQLFTLGNSKIEVIGIYFLDILTTQNDHPRYVKHVLGSIYLFFTLFGY